MIEAKSHARERATQLRRDFDRSFADPPPAEIAVAEDLLAIRLGTLDFALRLSEIAGLFAGPRDNWLSRLLLDAGTRITSPLWYRSTPAIFQSRAAHDRALFPAIRGVV